MGVLKKKKVTTGPILNLTRDRTLSIINNTSAIFEIKENYKANGNEPFLEKQSSQEVTKWCELSFEVAKEYDIDVDLIRAIIYLETTHGYYDHLYDDFNFLNKVHPQKSIRPMNINFDYWKGLGITKESISSPEQNIEIGALLLSRIIDRVKNPTVAKVATLYNYIGAEKVADYGARAAQLYKRKPWRDMSGGSCRGSRVW